MKTIALTQGQVALIDDEDFELVSGYKWYANYNPSTKGFYAKTNVASTTTKSGRTMLRLHRLLMNPGPGMQVDHINGNTLDNRRENLRVVSHADNMKNRKKPSDNTSGFKGVSWHKQKRKWGAQIGVFFEGKKKTKYLGFFDTAEEASRAYEAAAAQIFGEFNRALEHR